MSDNAARPRPAYGAYATPEEVAQARGMTIEEYRKYLASLTAPTPAASTASSEPAPVAHTAGLSQAASGGAPTAPAAASRPRHPVDRFVTFALLAFGLVTVITTTPGLLSLAEGLNTVFEQYGIGEYTQGQFAASLGLAAAITQAVLWLFTAWASFASLRRNRITWWIPLVAGAIAALVVLAVSMAALLADPGFADYVASNPSFVP
ncbi:DUF6264 family protein [Salinibacterium hongtaonis]|uniref:DUF6264 family protein n=1 Tax=Homoserinimonas hongtaonis TaxID=2079791 RepID=UPI000D3CD6F7|nr:DUF6264 family protein [Salinibacterium hongtaonis]AWB89766.1 hypothetical protein C2138_09660 [Salinibacterium hongtaonis]